MLCGPGDAPGRGLRQGLGAVAKVAVLPAVLREGGASRAAVGDPLAEGRCARRKGKLGRGGGSPPFRRGPWRVHPAECAQSPENSAQVHRNAW